MIIYLNADEPTSVPHWMVPCAPKYCQDRLNSPYLPLVTPIDLLKRNRGPPLRKEDANLLEKLTKAAIEAVVTKRDLLNELDSGCGDGDCGSCMEAGAKGKRAQHFGRLFQDNSKSNSMSSYHISDWSVK